MVVPSPATSFVLVATSLASCAPMFSHGSSSSTSFAIVTPSFVIVGAPHFLSRTTLWPFGPSVSATVSASLLTPASSARRASSLNLSNFAAMGLPPGSVRWIGGRGGSAPDRSSGCYFEMTASTSRADRIRYSSPSTLTSVPPYLL